MHRTILRILPIATVFTCVHGAAAAPVTLRSLLQNHGSLVSGPFTFDDFSLKIESSGDVWRTASAATASAVNVQPMTMLPGGLQFSGSATATSTLSDAKAIEFDYRLSSLVPVNDAGITLAAAALGGAAGFNDQLIVTPGTSSGAASQADTQWSSAGPTVSPGLSTSIEFEPATVLGVSDLAAVQPGDAAVVAFVVDNTFLPEPSLVAIPLAGWLLIRRRRIIL